MFGIFPAMPTLSPAEFNRETSVQDSQIDLYSLSSLPERQKSSQQAPDFFGEQQHDQVSQGLFS